MVCLGMDFLVFYIFLFPVWVCLAFESVRLWFLTSSEGFPTITS